MLIHSSPSVHRKLRFARRLILWCAARLPVRRSRWLSASSVSFVIHAVLMIALALLLLPAEDEPRALQLTVLPPPPEGPEPFVIDLLMRHPSRDPDTKTGYASGLPDETRLPDAPDIESPIPNPQPGPAIASPTLSIVGPRKSELLLTSPVATGGGFEGRQRSLRARLVGERGGTPESEDAVARGLAWLAAHQRDDGSWHFDHRDERCNGMCRDPGTAATTTGATGLALLPFLGAGEVGEDSQYRTVVERGLYYLGSRMLLTPLGGDLQEGTMYAQGIAAIALCEGYAMTGDESLQPVAQHAVDFICNAQHEAGGWRYAPGQPGDTTVFGWQLMALKSAKLAGLNVPSENLVRARAYLDSVQSEGGAAYGYMEPGKMPSPTAIGLLARMYLGWHQDDPQLAAGVDYLSRLGPSRTDVYFNYYATQTLHHHASPNWEAWNLEVRNRLIATQSRRGHEHGSWYFNDEHGKTGGRLYTTAMCVMILEVYYRYMPLYSSRVLESDL